MTGSSEIASGFRTWYGMGGVGGMRLECPVRVTATGGEMLTTTPLELTVIDA